MNKEENMVKCATDALLQHMGKDICSLNVTGATVITDYFVLASGNSVSQIDALVDSVEEAMKENGYPIISREGQPQGGWVLLDYGDIVVHIFSTEMREFYSLDRTWRDADKVFYE